MKERANLLIVDDEPVERQTLTDILRLEGYHVASVASGEAGVDHIRQNHVNVMILDLRMPGMSGLEVIKVASRIAPEVEIILLTAHGSMESAIEALRSRIHDYLLKPASPSQVIQSINRALAKQSTRLNGSGKKVEDSENDELAVIALSDGTVIDFGRRMIRCGIKTVFLTPAEGRLLRIFTENVGKVYSHRELVLLVQGYSASQQEAPEILRPLVSRLRQKLAGVPSLVCRIVSVRGTGYVFESD